MPRVRSASLVLAVWVGMACLSSIPYWLALRHTPPDHQFTGLVDKIPDGVTYLAKMRQGWEGNWLFENRYSYQDHQPVFLNPFLLLLGHLARLLRTPLIGVFHGARLLFGLLMLAAVFRFYREGLPEERQRGVALILFAFASGLGWLLPRQTDGFWVRQESVDVWMPEAIPFYAMMVNPLFCVSLALMAYILTVVSHLSRGNRGKMEGGVIPAVVLLALIHPYDIVVIEALIVATMLMLAVRRHGIERPAVWAAVILFPLPVIAFDAYVFHANPVMHGWLNQNYAPSPNPVWYVSGYAPLLVFALLSRANNTSRVSLASVAGMWLILGLPLAYSPLSFQRKLIMGWSIPLAGYAAAGLFVCWDKLSASSPVIRCALLTCIAAVLTLSNVSLITRICSSSGDGGSLAYLGNEEIEAMRWLGRHSHPRETVLTSPRLGLFVPAIAGNRVLAGHWSETEDFPRMCGIVNGFLSSSASPEDRSRVARRYAIRWVLSDRGELAHARESALSPLWAENRVVVYAFDHGR